MFFDAYDIKYVDERVPIMDQLVHIFENVNNDDIDANEKLLQWSEKKFEKKVLEKVSTEISIRQVELSNIVNNVEGVVQNIQNLYKILCDVPRFTHYNIWGQIATTICDGGVICR